MFQEIDKMIRNVPKDFRELPKTSKLGLASLYALEIASIVLYLNSRPLSEEPTPFWLKDRSPLVEKINRERAIPTVVAPLENDRLPMTDFPPFPITK